jgi:16S rRNA (cytosine967-C5)-methyltransferase
MSITTDGLIDIFRSKGMKVEKSRLMPDCIIVLDRGPFSGPINKLPGYDEGLFVVQDDASALVATILSAKSGQTIADLCAAPGGKSLQLGEIMENKGRVVAVDNSEKRLSLLGKERRRLSLTNIEAVVADGTKYKPEQAVDAVLLDAPCSGTGVINRRSDLRWHREEKDIESLVKTQRALLENAAAMLKPGAVLVYSTCSMEKEENQDNIDWFIQTHSGFKLDNMEPFMNQELLQSWSAESHWSETQKQLRDGYIQLLPSRHGCSGFFICRIKRDD